MKVSEYDLALHDEHMAAAAEYRSMAYAQQKKARELRDRVAAEAMASAGIEPGSTWQYSGGYVRFLQWSGEFFRTPDGVTLDVTAQIRYVKSDGSDKRGGSPNGNVTYVSAEMFVRDAVAWEPVTK